MTDVDVEKLRVWLQSTGGELLFMRAIADIDRITREQQAARAVDEETRNRAMDL